MLQFILLVEYRWIVFMQHLLVKEGLDALRKGGGGDGKDLFN